MHDLFLRYSIDKLRQHETRIQTCLDKLTNEQVWQRNAETQNAVGNLVLHLCGNARQWIVSAVDEQPDTRNRNEEFAASGNVPIPELKQRLAVAVTQASTVLANMPAYRLSERVKVQNYELSVLEAIYHVVEHFSYHTGQIIFATKLFTEEDLGFYKHLNKPRPHTEKIP